MLHPWPPVKIRIATFPKMECFSLKIKDFSLWNSLVFACAMEYDLNESTWRIVSDRRHNCLRCGFATGSEKVAMQVAWAPIAFGASRVHLDQRIASRSTEVGSLSSREIEKGDL